MNLNDRRQQILQAMQSISRMERGKLCTQSRGPASPPFYNLQTWEKGKNITRYVPAGEVPAIQEALAGHQRFQELANQFVALTVAHTRSEAKAESKKNATKSKRSATRKPKPS